MARKYYPFYNVDQAVGPNCPNAAEDVMLVQFFFRRFGHHPTIKPLNPPDTLPATDGVYTPLLGQWILWFQKALNAKQAGGILADGRVDPARGVDNSGFQKSTLSKTQYTIVSLNGTYRARFKKSHDALEDDPEAPSALRAAFRKDPYFD